MQGNGKEEQQQEVDEMEEEDGDGEDHDGNLDEDGGEDEEGDDLGGHAKMVAFHAAIKAVLTRQIEKMGQEVEASLVKILYTHTLIHFVTNVSFSAILGAQHREAGQPWE